MSQEQIFCVALGWVSFHPTPPHAHMVGGCLACHVSCVVSVIIDCLSYSSEQQKTTDSAKRKLDDLSYRDGSRKCLKTDVELETIVDMDIEETAGDNQCFVSVKHNMFIFCFA